MRFDCSSQKVSQAYVISIRSVLLQNAMPKIPIEWILVQVNSKIIWKHWDGQSRRLVKVSRFSKSRPELQCGGIFQNDVITMQYLVEIRSYHTPHDTISRTLYPGCIIKVLTTIIDVIIMQTIIFALLRCHPATQNYIRAHFHILRHTEWECWVDSFRRKSFEVQRQFFALNNNQRQEYEVQWRSRFFPAW